MMKRWYGPLLIVIAASILLTIRATTRHNDATADWLSLSLTSPNEATFLRPLLPSVSDFSSVLRVARSLSLVAVLVGLWVPFFLLAGWLENAWIAAAFTSLVTIHPETVRWASRAGPEGLWLLGAHAALVLFCWSRDRSEPPTRPYALWESLATGLAIMALLMGVGPTPSPGVFFFAGLASGKFGLGLSGICLIFAGAARTLLDARATVRMGGQQIALVVGLALCSAASLGFGPPWLASAAVWPLTLVGCAALSPHRWKFAIIPIAIAGVAAFAFLRLDRPHHWRTLADFDREAEHVLRK